MSHQLGIQDFAKVQEMMWEARSKWENIGTRLKLEVHELENIEAEAGSSLDKKFRLMIKERLKKEEPCTWKDFYDALNHPTVGMFDVAKKILPLLPTEISDEIEPHEENLTAFTNTVTDENQDVPSDTSIILKNPLIEDIIAEQEVGEISQNIDALQRDYIDISVSATEEFRSSVPVMKLRYSLLCLPYNIKKEHKGFIKEAKDEIKGADSTDDVMFVIGEHYDYLRYSLLKHVVDLYGSDGLKKKMAEYVKKMVVFRKETRLQVFSKVCSDEPEETNEKFATMVTKHQIDWKTATLEDVEKFRVQTCRELSLYDFSLNLVKVARGCVEVTWAVPRSLVTYIKHAVKPSSESMMEHHVSTLTIDGFIAYDSSFASMNEQRVIRLQFQAITSHLSYLMEVLAPEALVPIMMQRRLLTPLQGAEILEETTDVERVNEIVNHLRNYRNAVVGRLPTFCDVLFNADLPHVASKISQTFQSLLKGETVTHQQEEDEVMISGESSVQLSPPPPDSHLVTTQVEGSTLTRSQYNNVHSLTSSLLCLPTGALVYDGYTLNPTTIYWHTSTFKEVLKSRSFLTELAQSSITQISIPEQNYELIVPTTNEIDLLSACVDGDLDRLNVALENGGHADFVAQCGESLLMLASYNGHEKIVNKLLEHGATVDLQSQDGCTPLMGAAEGGHVEIVTKLINHGANVHIPNKDGWTPMMYACCGGHVEVVDILLQHGASVQEENEAGATSLMIASYKGDIDVVEKLLQHGAIIDLQSKVGKTALIYASMNGNVEVVTTLINHHATLDLLDKDGDTALTLASQENELDTVSLLLKAGANPNVCNKSGQTPLLLAVRKNNVAMVRELVEARVGVDHMEQRGMSALMMCCEEGNSEMAKLLLQAQANPNLQQSNTGYTALMFACHNGHLHTVITLLEHGANSQIKNKIGSTAFDVASINSYPEICSELMCWYLPQSEDNQPKDNSEGKYTGPHEEVEEVVRRVHEQLDQVARDRDEGIGGKKIPKGDYKRYLELRAKGAALLKTSKKKLGTIIPKDFTLLFK